MNVDFIGLSPPKAARVVVIAISAFAAGARLFILLAGGARIMTTLGQAIIVRNASERHVIAAITANQRFG
jgi:hypothetical protein